jgi:metal-sulfur cluster biosynthetic enzyme
MTDQPTTASTTDAASAFDPVRRARESRFSTLRNVVDPEIGMNVVELALIKQVLLGETESEVKMILTTPFCPYAGSMIAQVKEQAESALDHPVKVTLLAERWDPRERASVVSAGRQARPARLRDRRVAATAAPRASSTGAIGSPRTTCAPRPTARSTRRWRPWGWPGRSWS